jgi:hypothetical protein
VFIFYQTFDRSFLIKTCQFHFVLPTREWLGLVINKVLGTLLTKLVSENETNWDEHLPTILFFYTLIKISQNVTTPFTTTCDL